MQLFRKSTVYADFSMIGTDLHSHLLPGLDDGSPSMEESIRMARAMADAGYKKAIITPHVNAAWYPNTRERILGQLYHLQDHLREKEVALEVEASAEYHMDFEFMGKVESGEVIPFGPRNYLLVELPFQKPTFSYEEILYHVQLAGYEPIIAHPERYAWLMGNRKAYQALKDRGMHFQMNIHSLNGLYGLPAKMAAHQLIDAGMIDFAGSDAHYSGHIVDLNKALSNRYFAKLVGSGQLLNGEL